MDKKEAEDFIQQCLVDNEKKKPKDRLSRKNIVDILTIDFSIPVATAYRYYQDASNLYRWEQSKPDPSKQMKDAKDEILSSVLDEANSCLEAADTSGYFKGIELYSKLLTRFKKQ